MKTKTTKQFVLFLLFVLGFNTSIFAQICGDNIYDYITPLTGEATAENAAAGFKVETNAGGDIVITLSPMGENTTVNFRGNNGITDGSFNNIKINNEPITGAEWFTRKVNNNVLTLELNDGKTIEKGSIIDFPVTFEYATTLFGNLWPTVKFSVVYGVDCDHQPTVQASEQDLMFSPDNLTNTFIINGSSIIADLVISAPAGLKVSPERISPDLEGNITNKEVTVTWQGLDGADYIKISGGGLLLSKDIEVGTELFSEYCNMLISQENNGHESLAYLTVDISADKKELAFIISPYTAEQTVNWNNASIPADGILIDGVAPSVLPVRTREIQNRVIRISFDEAIQDGQKVSFGGPMVWTIKEEGEEDRTNCFINSKKVYTVGCACVDNGIDPMVGISTTSVEFTPDKLAKGIMLSGKNLTEGITLSTTGGYRIEPATIAPDLSGEINEEVFVIWDGAEENGLLEISGGGMTAAKTILLSKKNFSPYCDYLLSQDDNGSTLLAYMTIDMVDNKTVKFVIAPYNATETATWKGNSIPANQIKIDGNTPASTPTRSLANNDTEIVISFNEALNDGQAITFGAPLVWGIKENDVVINDNCFTNGAKTYIVGTTCPETLSVISVGEAQNVTYTTASTSITAAGPVVAVLLKEDDNKVADLRFSISEDDTYELTGLEDQTNYSFSVHAVDIDGNLSDAFNTKLEFTTLGKLTKEEDNTFESQVYLYPNPATEVIYFTIPLQVISIYSLQGQLVSSQVNVDKMNVSGLAKGLYVVQTIDYNGKQTSLKVEIR